MHIQLSILTKQYVTYSSIHLFFIVIRLCQSNTLEVNHRLNKNGKYPSNKIFSDKRTILWWSRLPLKPALFAGAHRDPPVGHRTSFLSIFRMLINTGIGRTLQNVTRPCSSRKQTSRCQRRDMLLSHSLNIPLMRQPQFEYPAHEGIDQLTLFWSIPSSFSTYPRQVRVLVIHQHIN